MVQDRRILVVDDDLAIRRLVKIVLTRNRCVVDEARNGFEAISAMNDHRYDAVLLDLMMPGCSGFEVLRFLGESGFNRRCFVVMTAVSDAELARLQSPLLFTILRKPFDIDEMVQALTKCIGSQLQRGVTDSVSEVQGHSN